MQGGSTPAADARCNALHVKRVSLRRRLGRRWCPGHGAEQADSPRAGARGEGGRPLAQAHLVDHGAPDEVVEVDRLLLRDAARRTVDAKFKHAVPSLGKQPLRRRSGPPPRGRRPPAGSLCRRRGVRRQRAHPRGGKRRRDPQRGGRRRRPAPSRRGRAAVAATLATGVLRTGDAVSAAWGRARKHDTESTGQHRARSASRRAADRPRDHALRADAPGFIPSSLSGDWGPLPPSPAYDTLFTPF